MKIQDIFDIVTCQNLVAYTQKIGTFKKYFQTGLLLKFSKLNKTKKSPQDVEKV